MSRHKSILLKSAAEVRCSIPFLALIDINSYSTQMDHKVKQTEARESTKRMRRKIICWEFTVVGREKGLSCHAKKKVEEDNNGPYRVKQGFHTDETEGEIRDGASENAVCGINMNTTR